MNFGSESRSIGYRAPGERFLHPASVALGEPLKVRLALPDVDGCTPLAVSVTTCAMSPAGGFSRAPMSLPSPRHPLETPLEILIHQYGHFVLPRFAAFQLLNKQSQSRCRGIRKLKYAAAT